MIRLGKDYFALNDYLIPMRLVTQGQASFSREKIYEAWVEARLVPVPDPGQVVILDNATFHKGGRIQQLIEQAGAQLLYLPLYSPDLNKIENCWSWLHLPRSQTSGSV